VTSALTTLADARAGAVAIGRIARPAPRVEPQPQHAQLLRRDRHLVRRERLELVDPSLVVKRAMFEPISSTSCSYCSSTSRFGSPAVAGGTPASLGSRHLDQPVFLLMSVAAVARSGVDPGSGPPPTANRFSRQHHRGVLVAGVRRALRIVAASGQAVIADLSDGVLVPRSP